MTQIPINLDEYKLLLSIAFGVENYLNENKKNDEVSQMICEDIKSKLEERLIKFNNLK